MKKIFIIVFISIIFVPITAVAVWWNPFTWETFISSKTSATQVAAISLVKDDATSEVLRLKKELTELKAKDRERERIISENNKIIEQTKTLVSKIAENSKDIIAKLPGDLAIDNASSVVLLNDKKLPLNAKQIAARVSQSVVLISSMESSGSGFVINDGSIIVTNAHVVRNASVVDVKLFDGTTFRGAVLGRDESMDLAFVSTGSNSPPAVSLGSSDINSLDVGDDVYALGFPLSLTEGLMNVTFTRGILSARQQVNWYPGVLLQTDAVMNHGNSGGPLINKYGEVIGVNAFGSLTPDAQGIFYAIPIDTVEQLISDLIEKLNHAN